MRSIELSKLTYWELMKLYRHISFEIFTRIWWLLPISVFVYLLIIFFLYRKHDK